MRRAERSATQSSGEEEAKKRRAIKGDGRAALTRFLGNTAAHAEMRGLIGENAVNLAVGRAETLLNKGVIPSRQQLGLY